MFVVHHRRFFFWLTGLILAGAIGAILAWGLPLGLDFTGGSLMQVKYDAGRPALADIQTQVATIPLGVVSVRASGADAVSIRSRNLTPEEHTVVLAVIFAIVLYFAWAFRTVSRPVPSWGYGLAVVAMLAIDIIVPTGFFAAYGHFTGAEVDSPFVVALLALLGYCVNDVIVIF